MSWGKIHHEASVSLAHVEASIGLPLIAGYVIGKCGKREPKRLEKHFKKGSTVDLSSRYIYK
jgi:hypothetical protein